jgi:hypothetical protein
VLAALPVDHHDDFACRVIDVDDNVLDQSTNQALSGAHGRSWRGPGRREVSGEVGEVRRLRGLVAPLFGIQSRLAGFHPA